MKFKTTLAGCGAGILVTLPYTLPEISPYHSLLYHSLSPFNNVVWGTLIDVALASLAGILIFGYLERNETGKRNLIWALAAGKMASLLVLLGEASGHSNSHVSSATAFAITLIAALALRWLRPPAYHAMARGLLTTFLLAGFSLVWIVPELLYLGLRHEPADWHGIARSVPADRLACRCGPRESDGHIVWLLFDELSYDQTFEHRFPGLAMPAFDQLRQSSVLFKNLVPAGYSTERVVPSLLLGDRVDDVRSDWDGKPLLRIAGRAGWHSFDAQSTLFADAERAGWTAGVAGWYNPYCRILAGTIDFCYEEMAVQLDGMTPDHSALKNAMVPVVSRLRHYRNKPDISVEHHEAEFQAIMQQAETLINDEHIRFLFIHLPVPHPPGIFNRKTGQMRAGGTYIDNLALADRSLGELLATLGATASAGKTTVIVCSDHSWRVPMWRPGPGWTKEEETASRGRFDTRPMLMIHFPGQSSEVPITQSFDEIKLHDILVHMLRGEINSPAEFTGWLQGNPTLKKNSISR